MQFRYDDKTIEVNVATRAGLAEALAERWRAGTGFALATINLDHIDRECELDGLVANQPRELGRVNVILNNSFGMLGINSVVIVRKI